MTPGAQPGGESPSVNGAPQNPPIQPLNIGAQPAPAGHEAEDAHVTPSEMPMSHGGASSVQGGSSTPQQGSTPASQGLGSGGKTPIPPKIKKSYNPAVFVGEAFKNLWRDGIMSVASVLVLASCLVVLGCFALLVLNINVNMNKLASLNEIVAFTEYDMSETDALALAEEIRKLDNVDGVEFISSKDGLEDLKETYPEFSDLFDEFEDNGTETADADTSTAPETPAAPETGSETSVGTESQQPPIPNAGVSPATAEQPGVGTEAQTPESSPADTSAAPELPAPSEPESEEQGTVGKNPLSHCFRIKYSDNTKVTTLEFKLNGLDGIRKVNNRQDLAMSLENMKDGISMIFIWFLVVLFIVSVFIIINTIKLAVNSHMEEIRVMKYIGASNWFIVIPYIIEGTIIGLFSGAIAFFVEWGIYFKLGSLISADTSIIEMIEFGEIGWMVSAAFIGIGILTGVIGSCISLRRNLNA